MKTIGRLSLLILMCGIGINISAQDLYANNYHATKNEINKTISSSSKDGDMKNKEYTWEFESSTPSVFDDNTIQKAEESEFGTKVACLKVLMEKYYISQEEVVPGDPTRRTIIKKPNIYNTTRKIEKYLKKEVKNGNINSDKATKDFTHILEVSLAAVSEENTESFEKALDQNKKNIEDQINIFKQVKINSIY